MIYLIIYLAIEFALTFLLRLENDHVVASEPGTFFLTLLFWPVLVVHLWSRVSVIRWRGKEIWRR